MKASNINTNTLEILITTFNEIIEKINLNEVVKPQDIIEDPEAFIKKAVMKNELLNEVWDSSNQGEILIDINNLFLCGAKVMNKRHLENFIILVNYTNSVR